MAGLGDGALVYHGRPKTSLVSWGRETVRLVRMLSGETRPRVSTLISSKLGSSPS